MDDRVTVAAILGQLAASLPPGELPEFAADLARVQAIVTSRLVAPAPVAIDELVDAAKMASILDVPQNWVRDKARAGALPFHQLGHYVRFSPREVLEAVRKLPNVPQLHDSESRIPKKRKETRGGKRAVSTECPISLGQSREPHE